MKASAVFTCGGCRFAHAHNGTIYKLPCDPKECKIGSAEWVYILTGLIWPEGKSHDHLVD